MSDNKGFSNEVISNGISAEDGKYGSTIDQESMYENALVGMQRIAEVGQESKKLGLPPSLLRYADRFDRVRWGVIVPQDPSSDEKKQLEILQPLINYRQEQMWGKRAARLAYHSGWTVDDFLWNAGERGISRGKMNPDVIPYYLAIVAPPDRVPWEFQQELSQDYAIGRIWFEDLDDCRRYVDHLLTYERGESVSAGREALFLGPQFPDDKSTELSSRMLVKQTADWLVQNEEFDIEVSLWLEGHTDAQPTKRNLLERFKGRDPQGGEKSLPSILFTGTHGLEYRKWSDEQHMGQGALMMQEWPGLNTKPQPHHYVSSQDITPDIRLSGTMGFLFACYSAGMPLFQDWSPNISIQLTDRPFVARLPQKLMANGMLALIGHVSKAWGYSFMGVREAKAEIEYFTEPIGELLRGMPVGHAISYLNEGVLHLIAMMHNELEAPGNYPRSLVNSTWLAYRDLKGYVVLGDPAARIIEPLTRN